VPFRGEHEHTLDSKDRLTVPRKFRDDLAEGYVLAKGPDACLWLYATKDFDELQEQYVAPHSPFGAESRDLRRMLNSSADDGDLDSAGRIRIPPKLKAAAGLDGVCSVVGVGKYAEIWPVEAWEKKSTELQDNYFDVAESVARSEE